MNLTTFLGEGCYFKFKVLFLILKSQLAQSLKKMFLLMYIKQLNVLIYLNHQLNGIGHFENIP